MTNWIVYYADGTTFSSGDGTPEEAPKDYVELVMQENELGGRDIMDGAGTMYEFYCWHADANVWIMHDANGLEQFRALNPDAPVLRGYAIPNAQFWALHNSAIDNPDWKGLELRVVRAYAINDPNYADRAWEEK